MAKLRGDSSSLVEHTKKKPSVVKTLQTTNLITPPVTTHQPLVLKKHRPSRESETRAKTEKMNTTHRLETDSAGQQSHSKSPIRTAVEKTPTRTKETQKAHKTPGLHLQPYTESSARCLKLTVTRSDTERRRVYHQLL
ncbi:hypothetical protein ElyMa_004489100 [Elysia marginata]|uniref:Uncharacterized protein n=1 Tax=Elysia marginata TaxID=1093978 RepID=A0AAV4HJA0_9GAST|nr:hypothetical protein ElyMa_004489100 [Elysia marginata]